MIRKVLTFVNILDVVHSLENAGTDLKRSQSVKTAINSELLYTNWDTLLVFGTSILVQIEKNSWIFFTKIFNRVKFLLSYVSKQCLRLKRRFKAKIIISKSLKGPKLIRWGNLTITLVSCITLEILSQEQCTSIQFYQNQILLLTKDRRLVKEYD